MLSRRKARARLERAIAEQNIVRVERAPKFADPLHGFVVAVGDKWVLLARTSDGGFFDGHIAFRLKDVQKVKRDTSFETAFAKTQPEWPPRGPADVDLGTTRGVIEGLSGEGTLLGVQKEHERAATWIGTLDGFTEKRVYIREVRPDASWHEEPLGYRLKAITTVETGGRYLHGLGTIAGTGPVA